MLRRRTRAPSEASQNAPIGEDEPTLTRKRPRLFSLPILTNLFQLIILLTLLSYRPWHTIHPASPIPHDQSDPRPSPKPHYDIFITVYAYDRPRHLHALLLDILRESSKTSLKIGVQVIDDNSYTCVFPAPSANVYHPQTALNPHEHLFQIPANSSYPLPCTARHRFRAAEALLHTHGWPLYISHVRRARRRYWFLVRLAHALLRDVSATHYLFLPDDDRLSSDFFSRVLEKWNTITDERKMTLMLHVESTRESVPVWTALKPRDIGNDLRRVGWVESGNFLCDVKLLRFLNWSFPAVDPQRWRDNPAISSGVGATLSELLHANGKRMYQTKQSFVVHMGVTLSKMNAEFRDNHAAALLTKHFADGDERYRQLLEEAPTVTASIASHWVRDSALQAAIDSLAHQVDHLNVYLNGYDSVPPFLQATYITVTRSQDQGAKGDIGDVGKFFWSNDLDTDFHLTADDDIVYPTDYVDKLLLFWRTFKPPVVVGVHGIRIKREDLKPSSGRRGKGYYGSRQVWMAVETVSRPVNVHIIGTGTMLYRPADIGKFDLDNVFRDPNMADIWFGIHTQGLNIPMMIIPHSEGWIREVPGTFDDSIYKRSTRSRTSDRLQTKAALSIPEWKLHKPVER